ncbi:hypothetical protein EZZ81_21180 [Pseudomonas viridiflava]|uniref:Uncharacterized protein n=1 Tax=Pseudomonas viridiflava TaxID=33069 RepID=A0AA46W271_PSEVI|nr:hypothetical protein EZZ81_21180 [Pseudomonas viridiflava]
MTWITLELGHTSAPHSRADAERPERHSHAERRNDQRDLKHADHAHACAQRYTRVLLRPRVRIQSDTFVLAPFCASSRLCVSRERGLKRSGRGLLLRSQHNCQVPQIIHLNAEALP